MKKILITGGAGFIGSHLCLKLLNEGNYIICLDNFYTGAKRNIEHLMSYPDFKLVEQSVIEKFDCEVDEIYNLACPASPIHYQSSPIETTKASVLGILNMLELANKYNAKILQASTSEVYGDPVVHPQIESYWGNVNPIGLRCCYDEGKRCAESLMTDYYRQYNTNIRIARIFNTYGPNMAVNDGRVISNFIVQALKNEPVTIYGNGNQTRSFCYVDDLINGLTSLMESNLNSPVNLGNPDEYTMLELAKLIIDITNSKSQIIFKPLPEDDPVKRKPDISLAKKTLGFSPTVSIKNGLIKTINYFKNII